MAMTGTCRLDRVGYRLTKALFKLANHFARLRPFPSYRGTVAHKNAVFRKVRFCLCYENVRDLPGYITEKLFDSFFSGCVPVYSGANNMDEYIPAGCYIDRRRFQSTREVDDFLKGITEEELRNYQRRMIAFLQSEGMRPFSSAHFVDIIAHTILDDLGSLI